MNLKKVHEARRLCEEMIDRGDAPCGLGAIRELLHAAITDTPDDDEIVELTAEPPAFGIVRPPAEDNIDARLKAIFRLSQTRKPS
ncbi:MAG TPA: hypothetical protein VH682_03375 [Gemmataceae bacterium]|jgi:hypothetical protein